jgi:hypothetical protein
MKRFDKTQKLKLDAETVHVLQRAVLDNVTGGVAPDGGLSTHPRLCPSGPPRTSIEGC